MTRLTLGDRAAKALWRIIPKGPYSTLMGGLAGVRLPRRLRPSVLGAFSKTYGIDLSEAEADLSDYESVQALFTRKLKAQVRPIPQDPLALLSPSDGSVCDTGCASEGKLLEAKGSPFTIASLLANEEYAARLRGGPYLVIYLSPRDYHRVHAPMGGKIVAWTHIPGCLFPVGPKSVRRETALFAKNERLVIHIETPSGLCTVVMVAAVGVGHITTCFDPTLGTHRPEFKKRASVLHKILPNPVPVNPGDELGVFNLGSTTITLFEPSYATLFSLLPNAQLKMGDEIGRIAATLSKSGNTRHE